MDEPVSQCVRQDRRYLAPVSEAWHLRIEKCESVLYSLDRVCGSNEWSGSPAWQGRHHCTDHSLRQTKRGISKYRFVGTCMRVGYLGTRAEAGSHWFAVKEVACSLTGPVQPYDVWSHCSPTLYFYTYSLIYYYNPHSIISRSGKRNKSIDQYHAGC